MFISGRQIVVLMIVTLTVINVFYIGIALADEVSKTTVDIQLKEAIDANADMLTDDNPINRLLAFDRYAKTLKNIQANLYFQIDQRVHEFKDKNTSDTTKLENEPKALAILLMTETTSIRSIPYLLKNLEYQCEKGLLVYPGFVADPKYPNNICVPVLRNYGNSLTEPAVQYLASAPKDFISDKQIEIISYMLHKCYGSGQSAIRIVTVLAEESIKKPDNPNIVRLINHLGNTYKP